MRQIFLDFIQRCNNTLALTVAISAMNWAWEKPRLESKVKEIAPGVVVASANDTQSRS